MDNLTSNHQETIPNTRRGRLMDLLLEAGVEEEEVEKMNRQQLMERWAGFVAQGHSTPPDEATPTGSRISTLTTDVSLERERFEFERQRYLEEKEERRRREEREEAEKVRREEERRRREEREEAEKVRREEERLRREERREEEKLRREEREEAEKVRREEERLRREKKEEEEKERDFKIREQQLTLERERLKQAELTALAQQEDRNSRKSLAGRIKFFNDALKGMFGKFPNDPALLPCFFDLIEKQLYAFRVDNDVKASLLLASLSDRAKALTSRLTETQLRDYAALKQFLLKEFRISPIQLRERFVSTRKAPDETYAALASRLRNTLMYYLRSRNIRDSFEDLVSLLCADRIKELLPKECLNFILTQEKDEWLKDEELATTIDTYMASHQLSGDSPRQNKPVTFHDNRQPKASYQNGGTVPKKTEPTSDGKAKEVKISKEEAMRKGLCFLCQGQGHRANACPKNKGPTSSKQAAQVSSCAVNLSRVAAVDNDGARKVTVEVEMSDDGSRSSSKTLPNDRSLTDDRETDEMIIDADEFHIRSYVDVNIAQIGEQRCLVDGGAEVCCIRESLVQQPQLPIHRRIRLAGLDGKAEDVGVVRLHLRPRLEGATGLVNIAPVVRVWAAAVPNLSEAVILTPSVVSLLKETARYTVLAIDRAEVAQTSAEQGIIGIVGETVQVDAPDDNGSGREGDQGADNVNTGTAQDTAISDLEVNNSDGAMSGPAFLDVDVPENSSDRVADVDTLAREQRACISLKPYFEQARLNKNDFFVEGTLV